MIFVNFYTNILKYSKLYAIQRYKENKRKKKEKSKR